MLVLLLACAFKKKLFSISIALELNAYALCFVSTIVCTVMMGNYLQHSNNNYNNNRMCAHILKMLLKPRSQRVVVDVFISSFPPKGLTSRISKDIELFLF